MGRSLSVLVQDPDPTARSMLEHAFVQEGWRVAIAGDGQPTVMVMTLRGGGSVSELEGLRTRKQAGVPLLVVGAPGLRTAALSAGAREFLPLPLFARDAVTVSKLLVSMPQGADDAPEVRGPISEYGLYFLLRAMAGMQRSGVLQLRRGQHQAELRFVDGEVVAAQVGPLYGVPAIFLLLLWDQATVTLRLRHVPRRGHLGKTTEELLSECERFLRDFLHAARDLGSSQTIYSRGVEGIAAAPLSPDVKPVYRLFDGRRTLCDVIGESPFRIFDTVRIIHRLIDAGAIQRRGIAPAPSPLASSLGDATLDAWDRNDAATSTAETDDNEPSLENRGVVDRRKTTQKLLPVNLIEERRRRAAEQLPEPMVNTPSPRATPMPVPTSAPPTSASGEVRVLRPRTPAPIVIPASTVEIAPEIRAQEEMKLPAALPLEAQALAPVSAQMAPKAAERPRSVSGEIAITLTPKARPGHVRETAPPQRVPTPVPHELTAATAFNAIEHDFFAREADLYKSEKVENFDDLDGPEHRGKRKKK